MTHVAQQLDEVFGEPLLPAPAVLFLRKGDDARDRDAVDLIEREPLAVDADDGLLAFPAHAGERRRLVGHLGGGGREQAGGQGEGEGGESHAGDLGA